MDVRRRLLFAVVVLCGVVQAYPQCEKEAGRSRFVFEAVSFEDAKAFPPDQLRNLIPILSGDAFSVAKVSDGLRAIQELYGEYGYVNFTAIPEARCDADRRTIHLTMILDEGPQFRVGKVLILAPENVAEHLYSAWPVKPGAIYNKKLVDQFFLDNRALLPAEWITAENLRLTLDEQSKSIEVRLIVCPAGHFCPPISRGR